MENEASIPVPHEERLWPAPVIAWTALALLSLAALVSFLDRIIVNLLVEPIKGAFHLNDTGFATLQGVGFGMFYTLMAYPLGRLADRGSRRKIIVIGLAAFSLFSFCSGLARQFWQLFILRAGVGIGEMSINPSSSSMLADYFPPHRLGRALGIHTMCGYLGIGMAFIAGGAAIGFLSQPGVLDVWFLRDYQPWQVAFMLVGTPGLIVLIPIALFLREPARRGVTGRFAPLPLRRSVREIWKLRKVLIPLLGGFAFVIVPGYTATVWTTALFVRVFGWTPAKIGFWYGLIYIVFATGGALCGGWLSDKFTARGLRDAPIKVAAFGFIGFTVFGGLAPLMPTAASALMMFAPAMFLSIFPYPPAATALQLVTPNQLRGQVTALYLTFVNLVGIAIGPILIGLFNDHLFTGPGDVRYSMAIVNALCPPLAVTFLLMAARHYRAALPQAV
jgi:MFS family permease